MQVKHDKPLDIAHGNSRTTKTWKNKSVLWSELLERLSTPTRTPETMAEYKAMSRDKQSAVKDVGAFVGGYCNNGDRKDVRHRSVLCLDADFADGTLWSDWVLIYDYAAAVYSTHKHTPEKPRLRLVIPLCRDVSPDEYQAIGRKIAYDLGIDKFDDTTYQPQRLMYYPSCSQDGEYVFEYHDEKFLDPDDVLERYHDWRDISAWPMSSRQAEIIRKSGAKQGDPLSKPGIVGAFCRTYGIHEAIEAFVPTYTPCDDGVRYTYTQGSTAAGVVTYDNKFSYSHHGTDPASGQLCNAFDLVRLHRFGEQDADADPTKPITSRPSYKAMVDLATSDGKVRAQLVTDRVAEAQSEFKVLEDAQPDDDSWKQQLKITEKGAIAMTIENVVLILRHDPDLKGALGLNELEHNVVARKSLPWREVKGDSQWIDADDAALRYYLERTYGISSKDKIFDAVNVVAGENAFHPVRQYLETCKWDGVPRLDTLLIDYLGAEDTPYVRAVTRKTLAAAVARIYRPGCKFDTMLTIQGRQGAGKSTLVAKLGGEWFSDTFSTMQGKEAYEQILGVWVVEIGELAGMRKAEVETIKQYLSKQKDRFRPAYGRRTQDFPRQCIFVGTTNASEFLRDTTGGRRFWIVDTPNEPKHSVWDELTPEIVRLVWGEAIEAYKNGEELYLTGKLEADARAIQESYQEENANVGIVAEYLDRLLPDGWSNLDLYTRRQWLETDAKGAVKRDTVCNLEIWSEALGRDPSKFDRYAAMEMSDIMNSLTDWRRSKKGRRAFSPYGQQRYYERVET